MTSTLKVRQNPLLMACYDLTCAFSIVFQESQGQPVYYLCSGCCDQVRVLLFDLLQLTISIVCRVIDNYLWTPSRAYSQEDNSVGREYDAWAKVHLPPPLANPHQPSPFPQEGILEHYWGEHIHLGYYESEDQHQHQLLCPYKKDFIQAKQDFVEKMLHFSGFVPSNESCKVLDVGCGIGGSSRLAMPP